MSTAVEKVMFFFKLKISLLIWQLQCSDSSNEICAGPCDVGVTTQQPNEDPK